MSKVRVGIIGIGFGQQVHVPVFRGIPDSEVAAVCARSQEKARVVAQRLGIERAFGDWRALVEDDSIDAVAIAVPPNLQAQIALGAMASGKAVFCEKPLATSVESASQMARAAHEAGVANAVDFEFPETPAWRAAKRAMGGGAIGELRHFAVHWNVETYAVKMGLDSWKVRSADGGGSLFSFASHVFYNLEWLAGPIEAITCHLPQFPASGETFFALTVQLQSGALGSISVSNDAYLGGGQRWEFYGRDGTMVLDNSTTDYINGFRLHIGTRSSGRMDEVCIEAESHANPHANMDGRIAAVTPIAARFIDWIRGGPPAHPDLNDGLRVQRLLAYAMESNSCGRKIQCS